jgi:hypothetical protein
MLSVDLLPRQILPIYIEQSPLAHLATTVARAEFTESYHIKAFGFFSHFPHVKNQKAVAK